MNILENLYYGNINPCEMDFIKDERYRTLQAKVIEIQDTLNKNLTAEECDLMYEMLDIKTEMDCIEIKEKFIYGFTLGIQIAFRALSNNLS